MQDLVTDMKRTRLASKLREQMGDKRDLDWRVREYLKGAGWTPTSGSCAFWRDPRSTSLQLQTLEAFGIQAARDAAGLTP